jgi:hypothetical protein
MFKPVEVSPEEAMAAVWTGDLPAPELVACFMREASRHRPCCPAAEEVDRRDP